MIFEHSQVSNIGGTYVDFNSSIRIDHVDFNSSSSGIVVANSSILASHSNFRGSNHNGITFLYPYPSGLYESNISNNARDGISIHGGDVGGNRINIHNNNRHGIMVLLGSVELWESSIHHNHGNGMWIEGDADLCFVHINNNHML